MFFIDLLADFLGELIAALRPSRRRRRR